jgi:cell division transport system permease protein
MGRISFFLREAFGSLRRNYFMTIAALVTVFLSMVVLGGVLAFVYSTNALLREVESKVEVTVYLKDTAAEQEITAMQSEISSWTEVKTVTFVSKDEALARLKEDFADNPEIFQQLRSNPLPASFEISLKDPKTVDAVAARFTGRESVDEVRYGKEIAQKLFNFTNQARNFLLIFIVLLGVVAILLISNTIRLSIFARRREVEIMKLVGATNWFIRWPFLIEGVTVGFLGAIAAIFVVLVTSSVLMGHLRSSLPFMSMPLNAVPYVALAFILLAVGVVIGAAGSGIGLRRFLKI